MARVTVEDCVKQLPNRFELVILGSSVARKIITGFFPTIDGINNKPPVVALRKIASGNISVDAIRESQIDDLRKNTRLDEVIQGDIKANQVYNTDTENTDDVFKAGADFSFDENLDFGDNFSEEEK